MDSCWIASIIMELGSSVDGEKDEGGGSEETKGLREFSRNWQGKHARSRTVKAENVRQYGLSLVMFRG